MLAIYVIGSGTTSTRPTPTCRPRTRVERLAELRTVTGAEQESWLLDGFRNSTQGCDILGQQVFFTERDRNKAPASTASPRTGATVYAASRRRITQGWGDANVRNAVVLTGGMHRNWANDVKVDY